MQLEVVKNHKKAQLYKLKKPLKAVVTNIGIPVTIFPYSGSVLEDVPKNIKRK